MSIFIINQIIKELEELFVSHTPELQQELLNEVSSFIKVLSDWVESKININGELSDEKKGS